MIIDKAMYKYNALQLHTVLKNNQPKILRKSAIFAKNWYPKKPNLAISEVNIFFLNKSRILRME